MTQRNGTTSLFAALEIAPAKATDRCCERHGKAEFSDFSRRFAQAHSLRKLHESWLNLVAVSFSIITRRALRRGSFDGVKELVAAVGAFIDG